MTRPSMSVLRLGGLALVVLTTGGCPDKETTAPTATATAAKSTAPPQATATATAAKTAEPKKDYGPSVEIAAGSLKAGSRCYDVPRVRPNELEFETASMGAFNMDVYPYPNKPGEPALLNVTHEKAAALCAERGKRLCTELEWERACKGDKNTTYMWGNAFSRSKCKGQPDHIIGSRPECKTTFGVMDMMGVALEWTASDWERGSPTGDKVVRGARAEKVSWLSARCAHSRKRNPHMTYDNVGFRCCSGAVNAAKVVLRQKKTRPVDEDPGTDTNFEMTLMRSMPRDHRGIVGVELSFDQVYRWHPVPNEEMIVARWKGKPKDKPPFYEVVVFKLCGRRAWRATKLRGPVAKLSKPKVGMRRSRLKFDVETGSDKGTVEIRYWHGTVRLIAPKWIKKGNQLDGAEEDKPKLKLKLKGIKGLKLKKPGD